MHEPDTDHFSYCVRVRVCVKSGSLSLDSDQHYHISLVFFQLPPLYPKVFCQAHLQKQCADEIQDQAGVCGLCAELPAAHGGQGASRRPRDHVQIHLHSGAPSAAFRHGDLRRPPPGGQDGRGWRQLVLQLHQRAGSHLEGQLRSSGHARDIRVWYPRDSVEEGVRTQGLSEGLPKHKISPDWPCRRFLILSSLPSRRRKTLTSGTTT